LLGNKKKITGQPKYLRDNGNICWATIIFAGQQKNLLGDQNTVLAECIRDKVIAGLHQ